MRKLIFILSAAATVGFTVPVVSAQAEEGKIVIKEGREHHRHWDRDRDHRKVVVIRHHRHRDRDHDHD